MPAERGRPVSPFIHKVTAEGVKEKMALPFACFSLFIQRCKISLEIDLEREASDERNRNLLAVDPSAKCVTFFVVEESSVSQKAKVQRSNQTARKERSWTFDRTEEGGHRGKRKRRLQPSLLPINKCDIHVTNKCKKDTGQCDQ